jgi:hypothetical protein
MHESVLAQITAAPWWQSTVHTAAALGRAAATLVWLQSAVHAAKLRDCGAAATSSAHLGCCWQVAAFLTAWEA